MHSCVAGGLGRCDLIVRTFFKRFVKCVLMHPCCREPWKIRSHVWSFNQLPYMCVLMLLLRWRQPWKMGSHLPWFISRNYIFRFDAFLRWRAPWNMRSHLPNFLSMNCKVCLMYSCAAAGLGRWYLIFQTFFLYVLVWVLMHSCAAGCLGIWDLIFQAFPICFIVCFDAFLRCRGPWRMISHLSCFIQMRYKCVLILFLRCWEPWKTRSYLPNFIQTSFQYVIWCVLMHSCLAGNLGR